jgi:hypothetical protein
MQRTPKEIADRLVQMYGNSPKGLHMPREDFEQHAERPGVDHRLIRSIDLELRPMGYILSDLLQERQCVVLMSITHGSPKFGGKSQLALSSGHAGEPQHHHRARR